MITCRQMVELVSDYLEDRLDAPARERFEEHLAVCPDCQEYVEQVRRTVLTLGRLPAEEELSPAARDEVLRAFADWQR